MLLGMISFCYCHMFKTTFNVISPHNYCTHCDSKIATEPTSSIIVEYCLHYDDIVVVLPRACISGSNNNHSMTEML